MPQAAVATMSGIPVGREKAAPANLRVDLLGMVELLLSHLTPTLCETVFKRHRGTERERKWTFYALCLFWAAVIVRRPPSLRHGIDQTRKGRGRDKLWPRVLARAEAFFEKAEGQRPGLFMHLYRAFVQSILPKAPEAYASWMSGLRQHFPEIHIVDGSRLDAVCHGLKILRDVRAPILPGCVTAFYDLYRGFCRELLFFPNAAQAELTRGQKALGWIAPGALIVGDRLYSSLQYFRVLADAKLFGLFRKNGRLRIKRLEVLSRQQGSRTLLEDLLVEVGCGVGEPKRKLRLIQFRGQGRSLDLLTSVLDPKMLSAEDAVKLYGLRWSVERLFLDLKETLELGGLYAMHPNIVAQQVYAAALVHAAFRVAQAKIAEKAGVLPEQLSPAKLFPKLAQAANDYCVSQIRDDQIRRMNPGVEIKFPSLRTLPSAYTRLGAILLERRSPHRRRRRFCPSRRRWKSFAHVTGGPTLLQSASVD
ncbi:MAG: transposase [Pseudomonadota bacterium]